MVAAELADTDRCLFDSIISSTVDASVRRFTYERWPAKSTARWRDGEYLRGIDLGDCRRAVVRSPAACRKAAGRVRRLLVECSFTRVHRH